MADSKRATVYDVAGLAGVSTATVSLTFSQPHRVKPATARAVLDAANELGWMPGGSAQHLALGRTGAIGMLSFDYMLEELQSTTPAFDHAEPRSVDPRKFPLFVNEVQYGAEVESRKRGYALMLGGGRILPGVNPVSDIAGRVDGLICFSGPGSVDVVLRLAEKFPVVQVGGEHGLRAASSVVVQNEAGMRWMTEHLLTVHGATDITYVGSTSTTRYDGYVAAMRDAGLAPSPALESRPGYDDSTVESLTGRLAGGNPPHAVLCATDQEALVALDVLAAHGLSVPGDVAVAGFDGITAGRLSAPRLTTMAQPMHDIGRIAVGLLADSLAGTPAVRHVELPLEPVLRESCGCGSPA